jgi:hypothetical protein
VAAADRLAQVPALEAEAAASARRRQLLGEDEEGTCDRAPTEQEEDRDHQVLAHDPRIGRLSARHEPRPEEAAPCLYNAPVGIFALCLLTLAVLLLLAAEWPRLGGRLGADARSARLRARKKRKFTVVEGEGDDSEDFAASVERDLANLPVIEERDDKSRR